MKHNDQYKAVTWAKEHWHVAGFICLCLPIASAILVKFGLLNTRVAVAACIASMLYVGLTTWFATRSTTGNPKP